MSAMFALLLAVMATLRPARAQDVLVPAGGWYEGPFLSCAIHEELVLAGSGPRLSIYDLTLPDTPLLVGELPLPFAPLHLAYRGEHLAAATGPQGEFAVVDLQDLAHPALLGSLDLGAPALGLALGDQVAYVTVAASQWLTDVRVLDLTDPAAPAQVNAWTLWEGGRVKVAQGRLWVGTDDGVMIYGLENPLAPDLLGTATGMEDGSLNFTVSGDVLYTPYTIWDFGDGVQAVNVVDPANPVQLGYHLYCYETMILGHQGPLVYTQCGTDGLTILDFSNPAAPVEWGMPFAGVVTDADQDADLLVSVNSGEFVVTSLATADAPVELARLATTSATTDVASNGRFAWLAQRGQIVTLDVRDPQAATAIGSYPTGEDWQSRITSLTLHGDTLIASCGSGLQAFRLDEDGLLHPLATLSAARDAELRDGILYVVGMDEGLHLYAVSNWSVPELLATLPLDNTRRVDLLGDLAVVLTNQPSVLHLVDVHDPRSPQELGQIAFPDWIYSLAVVDSMVYLGAGMNEITDQRLEWIDISHPVNPQPRGSLELPELALTMAISGNHLLAGRLDDAWLGLFELGEDGAPVQVQTLDVTGESGGVACVDNLVYLPAGDRGLLILRNTLLGDPAFTPQLSADFLPNQQLRLTWTRHPAAGQFRLEAAAGPHGPWEELVTTPDTQVITSAADGKRFFRVVQVYD